MMVSYTCPRCGNQMFAYSTSSIPPIISYNCYVCGYVSKPLQESHIVVELPSNLQQDDGFARIKSPEEFTKEELVQIISDVVDVYKANNGDMEYSGHSVEKILKDHRLLPRRFGRVKQDDETD